MLHTSCCPSPNIKYIASSVNVPTKNHRLGDEYRIVICENSIANDAEFDTKQNNFQSGGTFSLFDGIRTKINRLQIFQKETEIHPSKERRLTRKADKEELRAIA